MSGIKRMPPVMDAATAERAAELRRIAAVEIAQHREEHGFLGAALDGSLASGALWPTSDLDFTIVPTPEAPCRRGGEWGQRDGIVWHSHLNGRQLLLDLVDGYPESFIGTAGEEFRLTSRWLLDGLAVMEVIEDPEGVLAETKRLVAAHRFAPEVWEGRRAALLAALRRRCDAASEALEGDEPETAYRTLTRFAADAAEIWLEAAHRIYSEKEQDGQLREVAQAAGVPEAHALYHRTMGVQPERAEAAAPQLLALGRAGAGFFQAVAEFPPEAIRQLNARSELSIAVKEAWNRHFSGTLSLAPSRGHPAFVYQELERINFCWVSMPGVVMTTLREQHVAGVEGLEAHATEAARLAEGVRATLLGEAPAAERARACLAAAERLLELTERAR